MERSQTEPQYGLDNEEYSSESRALSCFWRHNSGSISFFSFFFFQHHHHSDSLSCLSADPLCLLRPDGCSVYKPVFVYVNFGLLVRDLAFHGGQPMFQATDTVLCPASHIQSVGWTLEPPSILTLRRYAVLIFV